MPKPGVNGFSGRVTATGVLEISRFSSPPEQFLDCRVLLYGYLADRETLKHRLSLNPARRYGDGELLASAFRQWGQDLQTYVLGEYAAVIWDCQASTALLTHDSLSLAQLFYANRSDGLVFATHITDLIDTTSADALDREYLADFLAMGFITTERTPYRSILRLLPGHSLFWRDAQVRQARSWSFANVRRICFRDDAEYEEQLRGLLEAGVRSALEPAATTWVSLSGGLDSSTIACVAAASGASRLAAYSVVCPKWPDVDERLWMKAVVDQCGLSWHQVDVEEILPFAMLPRHFHGEPSHTVIDEKQACLQNDLLSSSGANAMLTGHGGDTVFAVDPGALPMHFADPLLDGNPVAAFRAVKAWRNASTERRPYPYWFLRTLLLPAVRHLRGRAFREAARGRSPLPPWIKQDYSKRMQLAQRAVRHIAPRCRYPGRQVFLDSIQSLALAMNSGQQRGSSFALRAPLMYRPLVEFMYAIPWEQKLRPRCDRYLLRRALKGVLPEIVRRRAGKAAGNQALVEGLRRAPEWVDYLCDRPLMAELGIVDVEPWRNAVRLASVGRIYDDRLFLAAVAVEAWLKQLAEYRRTTLAPEARAIS